MSVSGRARGGRGSESSSDSTVPARATKGARVVVTGLGVVAPTAVGVPRFSTALREGRTAFTSLRAEGVRRELPVARPLDDHGPLSSLLKQVDAPQDLLTNAERIGRRSAVTVQVALVAALEAVTDAGLASDEALHRCGVVVAGQNLNQRTLFENAQRFAGAPEHLSPAYAMHHLDTDHVGAISELIGASGSEGMTIGGASASGNVAIVQAMRLVRDGYLDTCVVVGAMTDLSPMELAALESLGALAGEKLGNPDEACRPFDRDREGFVYGQSCSCLVIESLTHAKGRGARHIVGELLGGSIVLDGRRSTEPSAQGEATAMRKALADANVQPEMLRYVNAHGTSSRIGDSTEIEALLTVIPPKHLAEHVWVNSTKGLIGHGLSAAGVTEAVATLIQMRDGFVHPNKNLVNPIHDGIKFAPSSSSPAVQATFAMSNSFGFGGFNSSIILGRGDTEGLR